MKVTEEIAMNVDSEWHYCENRSAPENLLCEFWRPAVKGREERRWIGYAREFSSEFNIANLRWRLTGIAKEELAKMNEQQRTEVLGLMSGAWQTPWMAVTAGMQASTLNLPPRLGSLTNLASSAQQGFCQEAEFPGKGLRGEL